MKKLQKYLMVLMMVFMGSVVFSSCGGDDDGDNSQSSQTIQSMWKCVSTTHTEIDNPEYDELGFDVGTRIKLMEDGICFIDYDGDGFELPGGGYKENPTKWDWNSEDGEKWLLKGNILTIIAGDLDRWVGTVSINGNEMTFIYKYQNWNSDKQTMTWEGGETYTSKFIKQ